MILKRTLIYDGGKDWIEATLRESRIHNFIYTCPKGKIYEVDLTEIPEKGDKKGEKK